MIIPHPSSDTFGQSLNSDDFDDFMRISVSRDETHGPRSPFVSLDDPEQQDGGSSRDGTYNIPRK